MFKSIKWRIGGSFILVALIPIIILATASVTLARNALLERVEQQLLTTVDLLSDQIDQQVNSWKQQMEVISLENAIISEDLEATQTYFQRVMETNGDYESLLLIGSDGISLIHDDGSSGIDITDRGYYSEAIKGNVVVSDVLISRVSNEPVVVVAAPIYRNNQIDGVVLATVNMSLINSIVKGVDLGSTGEAYLANKDGYFITESKYIDNAPLTESVDTIAFQEGIGGISGTDTYQTYTGNEVIGAYSLIPTMNWALIAEQGTSEAFAHVNQLTRAINYILLGAIIFCGIFSIVTTLSIIKPINRLMAAFDKAEKGDMTIQLTSKKLKQCWKEKKCNKTDCPAYESENLRCWQINGTHCRDQVQGNMASKIKDCNNCAVYQHAGGSEIDRLEESFNNMLSGQKDLISNIIYIAKTLAESSSQLANASEQVAQSTEEISTSISEVAIGSNDQRKNMVEASKTLVELSSMIQMGRVLAEEAKKASVQTSEKANAGERSVDTTIGKMAQINESVSLSADVIKELEQQSQKIGEIIEVISGIAEQTNLLALNAAIEAARAGESGRGFAVVAEEVRKLAENSQKSSQEITSLVTAIQAKTKESVQVMVNGTELVNDGSKAVQETKLVFKEIINAVNNTVERIDGIYDITGQEIASSDQIVNLIDNIAKVAEQNDDSANTVASSAEEQASSVEEVAASAEQLNSVALKLVEEVSHFKINKN
ncbi:MAG: methyl-accepting chemotaxis protein [Bacillota bacterium]|nr:methyl-accepting chemotaxis protein [Bacillota bacterium]